MKEFLKRDNIIKIAILSGAVLIFIIFLSSFRGKSESGKISDISYESKLEQRIVELLSCIDGISEDAPPHVMIRLDKDGLKVTGTAIVCSAASDPVLREKIIECVSKTLSISFSEICVTY